MWLGQGDVGVLQEATCSHAAHTIELSLGDEHGSLKRGPNPLHIPNRWRVAHALRYVISVDGDQPVVGSADRFGKPPGQLQRGPASHLWGSATLLVDTNRHPGFTDEMSICRISGSGGLRFFRLRVGMVGWVKEKGEPLTRQRLASVSGSRWLPGVVWKLL
jgi:hypothetical protein